MDGVIPALVELVSRVPSQAAPPTLYSYWYLTAPVTLLQLKLKLPEPSEAETGDGAGAVEGGVAVGGMGVGGTGVGGMGVGGTGVAKQSSGKIRQKGSSPLACAPPSDCPCAVAPLWPKMTTEAARLTAKTIRSRIAGRFTAERQPASAPGDQMEADSGGGSEPSIVVRFLRSTGCERLC